MVQRMSEMMQFCGDHVPPADVEAMLYRCPEVRPGARALLDPGWGRGDKGGEGANVLRRLRLCETRNRGTLLSAK